MHAPDENALQQPVIEPRYDPLKAATPRVRVRKIPYSKDPMKEGVIFQVFGCAYHCYGKKTKGRSQIQLLGEVEPVVEYTLDGQTIQEGEKEET